MVYQIGLNRYKRITFYLKVFYFSTFHLYLIVILNKKLPNQGKNTAYHVKMAFDQGKRLLITKKNFTSRNSLFCKRKKPH